MHHGQAHRLSLSLKVDEYTGIESWFRKRIKAQYVKLILGEKITFKK